jgi:hypothetical protein
MYAFALLLEVMDKEPSLLVIWSIALFVGLAAFFVAREWRLGWLVCIPLLALATLPMLNEQCDPVLGPMIRQEAGLSYRIFSHLAIPVLWGSAPAGWLVRRRSVRQRSRPAI